MKKWKECFGIDYPQCKMCGMCCRMASPSLPVVKMLAKAAEGDSFARDFLTIFEPISNEEARLLSSELYDNARLQAEKSPKFDNKEQVVFYKCRYLKGKNECLVYEDRPRLCRDYPDSPFLIMHPDCAFKEWSTKCKVSYKKINNELKALKNLHGTLSEVSKPQKKLTKKVVYNGIIVSPPASWVK